MIRVLARLGGRVRSRWERLLAVLEGLEHGVRMFLERVAAPAFEGFARYIHLAGVRLLIPGLDLLALAYLWAAANAFYSYLRFGSITYSLLHWRWMVLVVVGACAVWEAFGRTLGMRVFGRALSLEDISSRLLFLEFFPLFPLVLLTAPFDREGRSPAELISGLSLKEARVTEVQRWYRTSLGWFAFLTLVCTMGTAMAVAKVNFSRLVTGFPKTIKFWQAILSPRWDLAGLGLKLLGETIFMAIVATAFAVPVAASLSFFAARNLMRGALGRPVYLLLRAMGSVVRSIDAVIWAIIFAVWVGTGSFAGVLALWIHSIVDLMKLYAEQLEHIDPGPVEAITATGANFLQVVRYGIIPQIINPYLSFTLYRWDINVRMATVVGLVGGGGIGFRLASYLRSWAFAEATMLTIIIVIVVWLIDYLSARLREKLA